MSENKKLELLDQYDDVTFALLMDEYAEEEGARLRKEFEEAQAAGEVSDTSDALDEKCLQMIRRDFAKKRGKENVRKIIRMTSKVAVAVMVFFGVAATTIMSVEAFRVPVLNYLFEHQELFSVLNYSGVQDDTHSIDTADDPIIGILPDGYVTEYFYIIDNMISSGYSTPQGASFIFDMSPADAEYRFDTENSECEYISINGQEVLLITKDGLRTVWINADSTIVFSTISTGIDQDTLLNIISNIMQVLS